ncbi:hypothetical protein AB0B25_25035 [Nocardia sp. NPDC049190]|uniref:hypothetical protein n=1 Tax=Nocardia sp. NPDC049190 TaxID=3155650 RepID=UPI0033DB5B76
MGFQLPHPEVLWARMTVFDVITSATHADEDYRVGSGEGIGQSATVVGGRLSYDDREGNWYTLIRYSGDRALLFGTDEDNKVAGTAYDPLATAPAWVRSVELTAYRPRTTDGPISFVRWWEYGQWHHTPTDLDDGLEMSLSAAADRADFTGNIMSAAIHAKWVEMDYEAGKLTSLTVDPNALNALCDATETGTVSKAHLYFLSPDLTAAAFAYLSSAGVLTGTEKPTEPLS